MAKPPAAGKALEHGTLAWLKSLELDQALSFVIGRQIWLEKKRSFRLFLFQKPDSQHCSRILEKVMSVNSWLFRFLNQKYLLKQYSRLLSDGKDSFIISIFINSVFN
jgi:hypothetical protein